MSYRPYRFKTYTVHDREWCRYMRARTHIDLRMGRMGLLEALSIFWRYRR